MPTAHQPSGATVPELSVFAGHSWFPTGQDQVTFSQTQSDATASLRRRVSREQQTGSGLRFR